MNDNVLFRISRIVSIAFMLIGVVFILIIFLNGDTKLGENVALRDKILNPYFGFSYLVFGLCILAAILFPVLFMIKNPKQAVKGLLILAGFAILFGVSYLFASDSLDSESMQKAFNNGLITAKGAKLVSMGLIGTYVISAIAILALIYSGISKIFK